MIFLPTGTYLVVSLNDIKLVQYAAMIYLVRGHRKWLPINHPYRRQRAAFNGKPEYGTPPAPLTGEEVLHMVEDINYIWGSTNGGSVGKNDGDRVCWKKKSKFFDLEY
ncbi:unnamed protein product [Prunus armeniaca]